MGHAQTPGEQEQPLAPAADALRCLIEEGAAWLPPGDEIAESARALLDRLNSEAADLEMLGKMLRAAAGVRSAIWKRGLQAGFRFGDIYNDPRLQAAAAVFCEAGLAAAEDMANGDDPEQWPEALQIFDKVEGWAERYGDAATAGRARLGRKHLLPVTDTSRTEDVLARQLNAAAGGRIVEEGRETFQFQDSLCIRLLPVEEMGLYPDEARRFLRRELGVDAPVGADKVIVPFPAAIRFLRQRVREFSDAAAGLEARQAEMERAAASGMSPVELARRRAVPLYQASARMQEEQEDALRRMGVPGEEVLERIRAVRHRAAEVLRAVPLRELPQALSDLRFEPRVLNLLRFRAVREAVLDPEIPIDMLTHLPELAPRAVAALKGCELVEGVLAARRRDGKDRRVHGPQTDAEAAALAQGGALLRQVGDWAEQRSGEVGQERAHREGAVAALVDALSEHAPPERAPLRCGENGSYEGGSRLEQARLALREIWACGLDAQRFSIAAVRRWAEAAGMPLGRYADRDDIAAWLRADTTGEQAQRERLVRFDLSRKEVSSLRAVDRTGKDRLYRVGGRVRLSVDGQEQEGEVAACVFLPGDERDEDGITQTVYPGVVVLLPDGRQVTVPIAEIEAAEKSISRRRAK